MNGPARGRRKHTARELGQRFNRSPRTIRRVMAEPRADFEARANERRAHILELHRQGLGVRAIGRELGIEPSLVSKRLNEARANGVLPPKSESNAAASARREAVRAFHDDQKHTWPETAEHFGIGTATACRWAYRARADRAAKAAEDASPDV